MATFGKATFNASSYAAFRPTYPRALFDFVYTYHERSGHAGRWGVALDLGCGTGQATTALTRFDHVIGIDPSESMIQKARDNPAATVTATAPTPSAASASPPSPRITFLKHSAEDLDFLQDRSVDLVVSAQAAHWFDYERLWPQLARVLRRDASVAFWGYSQFRITDHPALTPLIRAYCQGADPTDSVGPYWDQPGRDILDNHLLDVPRAPEEAFKEHEHVFWTGTHYPSLLNPRPLLLQKRMPWEALQAYLRTFSSLYTYNEHHPTDAAQRTGLARRPVPGIAGGGGGGMERAGDVVERFWWRLKEEVARENGGDEGEEVGVEWPLAMVLCKRA